MRRSSEVAQIDFAAFGLMIANIVYFAQPGGGKSQLISAVLLLGGSILLWGALRGFWTLGIFVRMIIAAISIAFLWWSRLIPAGRSFVIFFFFGLFILFSPATTRWSGLLRSMCGFFAGVLVFSLAPPLIGIPCSIMIGLVFVGAQIAAWSSLPLGVSLLWFAKRSIRKETVFVIIFLAGIAALGLQQAQRYALRQAEVTGLSHMITPGSMHSLALSPALAMRVRFKELHPANPDLIYFRGTVMDRFAGFNWLQGPSRLRKWIAPAEADFSYDVALSSRHAEFAPVIDYGVNVRASHGGGTIAQGRDNGVFFPLERSDTWSYYQATSRADSFLKLDDEDRGRLLQVPKKVDVRIINLAKQLGGDEVSVKNFIGSLARYLRSQGFKYSLTPENPGSTLEDFLFGGKSGYCEHFASATSALARIAGIPARVVAGFLGGEWDEGSQTLYVRDLDAHAWSELWDDATQSWVRFDPVEYVAPDRFSIGADGLLRLLGADIPDELAMREKRRMASFLMEIDNLIAVINSNVANSFAESVIDYGGELTIVGLVGLIISFVMMRVKHFRQRSKTRESRMVANLSRILRRFNINRLPGETTYSWLQRAANDLHVLGPELIEFADSHARYCYSPKGGADDWLRMKHALRRTKRSVRQQADALRTP